MDNIAKERLASMVLAAYIQKATTLIGVARKVGGNQFRHGWAAVGILLDHRIYDEILLKGALIHDLYEDWPDFDKNEIINLDIDGPEVHALVLEVTKRTDESKTGYLERILSQGTSRAKILKVADRISNLTDLNIQFFSKEKCQSILIETEQYIVPMAQSVNPEMLKELVYLVSRHKAFLNRV